MSQDLISCIGWCEECDFTAERKNAQGLMAQHHYKTGHRVHCELVYSWSMPEIEPTETEDE